VNKTVHFVAPRVQGEVHYTDTDKNIVTSAVSAAGTIMSNRQNTYQVTSEDNAVGHAKASLMYSVAYAFAAALITGAICLVGYLNEGGGGSFYAIAFLFFWGVSVLVVLYYNRGQGLQHSSAGIALEEIKSRERVAMFAISKHIELVQKKLERDNES
jgi:hypothetical protein